MKRLLVIDGDLGTRESLRAIFSESYELTLVGGAVAARDCISRAHFDLVMLDVVLPEMDGISFLHEIREVFPEIPAILISASHQEALVRKARDLRAVGFIYKPFDVYELRQLVAQTLQASSALRQQWLLKREIAKSFPVNVIGESVAVRHAVEAAKRASQSRAPVLIVGENGTGREFFARQIHSWSSAGGEPFIKVACRDTSRKSIELDLFGAIDNPSETGIRPGALDLAVGGSVYLEEAQRLCPGARELIRQAIAKHEFHRVDAPEKNVPYIARFFASCHLEAGKGFNAAEMLADLEDSFSAHVICAPALRDRAEDIPLLAVHYLNQYRMTLNAQMSAIDPEAMRCLKVYSWPGNIRELRNVVERVLVLHGGEDVLRAEFLPKEITGDIMTTVDPETISFQEATDRLHRQMILSALKRTGGVVKNAAALLDVTPRILQHRMDKLGIGNSRLD